MIPAPGLQRVMADLGITELQARRHLQTRSAALRLHQRARQRALTETLAEACNVG